MPDVENVTIAWSDYVKYRIDLTGFDPRKIEEILRYSTERYFDTATGRMIAV